VAGGALYVKEELAFLRSPNGISMLLIAACVSSVLFTFKIKRNLNSFFLFICWVFFFHQNLLTYNPGVPFVGWLLLALSLVENKEERYFWENKSPTFQFPPLLFFGLWIIVTLSYTASGIHKLLFSPLWKEGRAFVYILDYPASRSSYIYDLYLSMPLIFQKVICWLALLSESTFFILFIIPKLRKWGWIMNTLMHVGILIILKFSSLSIVMIIIHAFMIEDQWFKIGGISRLKFKKPIEHDPKDRVHA
jgi:hypothetical protein